MNKKLLLFIPLLLLVFITGCFGKDETKDPIPKKDNLEISATKTVENKTFETITITSNAKEDVITLKNVTVDELIISGGKTVYLIDCDIKNLKTNKTGKEVEVLINGITDIDNVYIKDNTTLSSSNDSTKNLGNVFVNGSDVILLNVNNIKINTIDYQSKTLITLDSKASIINEVNKDNKTNEKTPEKPVIGEKKYTVTFDTDGGNTITKIEVIDGQKLTKPKDPVKKGYIFVRWWLKTEWFNFNNPITKDITIKAEWKSKTPAPIIKATGINMLLTKTLMSKDVFTIKGNVEPANAANQGVTYTSSDPSVATVDNNGKITAIKGGSAIITATTLDGGYKATCTVTVNPKITFEIVDLGGQSNKVMGVKAIIDGVQATTGSIKFGTETMKINSTGVANFAVIEGITKDNVNTCTYIK